MEKSGKNKENKRHSRPGENRFGDKFFMRGHGFSNQTRNVIC